ncbi:hypothetical protein [Ciceribacter sp. T2.26MG-112.2]|uniref:hypothetical protein n=1 Tax=Ciceribacter sp. T2.26MG-112.2 TaxID=3137154 RepID=UPI0012B69EFC|nr:hypothetical protein [Ciceribacter naphthalenivorans]
MMVFRSDHEKVIDEAFGFKERKFRDLARIEQVFAFALLALILASVLHKSFGNSESLLVDSISAPGHGH